MKGEEHAGGVSTVMEYFLIVIRKNFRNMETANTNPASGLRKEAILSNSDNLKISILICQPREHPKAVVQIVHGMCEHKERYIPFMEFLASHGFACIIHDHRGHGESVKSSEDLGYFYEGGYLALVEDIHEVTKVAKSEFPGLPVILLGHSMGSMAVRSYAKRHDDEICGLIVCGCPSRNGGAAVAKLAARAYALVAGRHHRPKLIQELAFGAFNRGFKGEESEHAWVCSDPEIVRNYDADPLCNFQFTNDGFINLFSLMQDAYRTKDWKAGNPSLPVLFISGEEDPCLINRKKFLEAVQAMKKVGYENVRHILYPGMRHEILNETGKEKVWKDVLEFLQPVAAQG